MPRIDFDAMPDEARVWIFGSGRTLSGEEVREVLGSVDAFLETWAAHGSPLTCARDWRHDRFLLVAVDERTAPPSGCSIDALVRRLKDLENRLGTPFLGGGAVWYRREEEIVRADRAAFRDLVERGEVGGDTTVFDDTVIRLADVRAGRWERPARSGWHQRAFFRSTV